MKNIRMGVVGLGHRGRGMGNLAAGFPGVEMVAFCDLRPDNFYKPQWFTPVPMAELYPEAAFFTDYEKMLEEADLDVVMVETGADVHCSFCVKALEHNIHVQTDIPVVANLREAEEIWKAAEASQAMISVGANPNEQKFTVLLKEFYEKGLLGEPYCMEAEYIHWSLPKSDEHIHLVENGDWRTLLSPIRYCTHSLGPLLTVLKGELRSVSCYGTGQHGPREEYANPKKHDMMCAQFQADNGTVIRLLRNGRCRAKIGHHNYRVFGSEGYMERIERNEVPVIRYNSTRELDVELKEISGEYMPPAYANDPNAKGHGGMDYALLDHFFQAVRAGGPAPISLREGLKMTLPGIYAEASAERGGQVLPIRYPWDPDWTTEI